MILVNLRKLNSLVATYKDNASTEAEKESSRNLICKMIEKETKCERWVSANIFNCIIDGEILVNYHMENTINKWHKTNHNIIKVITETISKIGLVYQVFEVRALRDGKWMKKIIM
jgi:hypothetical protein